jgi:hypothetical protein
MPPARGPRALALERSSPSRQARELAAAQSDPSKQASARLARPRSHPAGWAQEPAPAAPPGQASAPGWHWGQEGRLGTAAARSLARCWMDPAKRNLPRTEAAAPRHPSPRLAASRSHATRHWAWWYYRARGDLPRWRSRQASAPRRAKEGNGGGGKSSPFQNSKIARGCQPPSGWQVELRSQCA